MSSAGNQQPAAPQKTQQQHLDEARASTPHEDARADGPPPPEDPETVTAQMGESTSGAGKVRALLGLLTKFVGVKDVLSLYEFYLYVI